MKSDALNIIPRPSSVRLTGGSSVFGRHFEFINHINFEKQITVFNALLKTNLSLDKNNMIELILSDKFPNESYRVSISNDRTTIEASHKAGILYGLITLVQILNISPGKIHNCIIEDQPQFEWRGMHLDVSRHFFGIAKIKKYLDLLALYKFNRFHWHLIDDQGWRLPIEKYPKLNQIASYRLDSNSHKYGGFYTKEEIKEIISYATERNIIVVPEIEMPGHVRSALAAYPDLSCTGEFQQVPDSWGIFEDVYCAGKDKVFEFLTDVLDEVIELFPSPYIHIGGDECPKLRWQNCPDCQKRIEVENLKDESELQSYFINRIAKILKDRNRQLIGWDEILEGDKIKDAIIMVWRSMEKAKEAINRGHKVILSPTSYCYFDYYQSKDADEPKAIGGHLPLIKAYRFYEELKRYPENILGGQANVWTEYMPEWAHIEYMTVPRIMAIAESLWSEPSNNIFNDFLKRVESHKEQMKRLGYNYHNKKGQPM